MPYTPQHREGQAAVSRLLADWQAARAALAEIERAEHPDITDRFGRVWTWRWGDLYTHCGSAVPADWVPTWGLPSQRALDNPNYDLCDICLNGRTRNVPDCKPGCNCTHSMRRGARS